MFFSIDKPKESIETRVVRAAEAALASQNYVTCLDVFSGARLLLLHEVQRWKSGTVPYLEAVIMGSPDKQKILFEVFGRWAQQNGLLKDECVYQRRGRAGVFPLPITEKNDPQKEHLYRTVYFSPSLPESKRKSIKERLSRPEPTMAVQLLKEMTCSDCGEGLEKNDWLFFESGEPLCVDCAGFSSLEFLPAGDVALTRRATKYSERFAVIIRFSRARKRYERQGVLVEIPALERAEKECLADADERAVARVRAAGKRQKDDAELVVRMAKQIQQLFPGCPEPEARKIAQHTAVRGSGRVGRSEAGRSLEESALTAAVIASIRHLHTNYDRLLEDGVPRRVARQQIADKIERVLSSWRS